MRLVLCNDNHLIYDTDNNLLSCSNRPSCLDCPLYQMAIEEGMITGDDKVDCKRAGIITAFSMLEHNIKELIKLL